MLKKTVLSNKNILVTGGDGFIGTHLVQELRRLGIDVFVFDIKTDLTLDVRNLKKLEEIFKELQPEFVFHLAAQAIVTSSYDNPREALETNVMGTVNVLEAVRKSDFVKGIIVASSDKAYGKLTKGKYREDSPLKGDHPYDVSKSAADLISMAYHKTYDLPVVVTRFGNVYGEGDLHFDRIIPGICESIIKKKILEIRSNGQYVRDYLYVQDVVDGYLFLMKNFDKVKGEAFNFSSSENLSVLELVKKAEKILGKKIDYKILDKARNEIPYQHLDDDKIKKLGWEPKIDIIEGLKKTYLWYKDMFMQ